METDGVQYDALEGLTTCAEDDPDCLEASPAPELEDDDISMPSIPPTEIEELPSAVPSAMLSPEPSLGPTAIPEPLGDPGIVCAGAFADALQAPYTSLSVAQIGACFDDCQDWISWHGSFGDTLPAWCSGETASPSEPPDASADSGWCWGDYGQWKLWGEAKGDPLCEGVETP